MRRFVQGAVRRTFVPPFGSRWQYLVIAAAVLMLAWDWIEYLMSAHQADWMLEARGCRVNRAGFSCDQNRRIAATLETVHESFKSMQAVREPAAQSTTLSLPRATGFTSWNAAPRTVTTPSSATPRKKPLASGTLLTPIGTGTCRSANETVASVCPAKPAASMRKLRRAKGAKYNAPRRCLQLLVYC
jgi:hypothetical protein